MNSLSTRAPWRSNRHQYKSLDDLNFEKENVTWYWRLIAQIASWMILGGYLILPTTFDDSAQIRFSNGVLSLIIIALLTGGYALTALVWLACSSILFRVDSIFIPILSVSLFGFLATIYAFASSPRYSFSSPSAPITLALTVSSAIVYGGLALFARRKVSKLILGVRDPNNYLYNSNHNSCNGTSTPSHWAESGTPGYYHNFIQNMHPTARSPNSFDGASAINTSPPTEDEMVNQQMARLLHKPEIGTDSNTSQSTFRLEWPQGEEDEMDQFGRRRVRTFSAGPSGALLAPERHSRESRSHSESSRSATWAQISQAIGSERGKDERPRVSGPGHQRAKSREERRQEIELATL